MNTDLIHTSINKGNRWIAKRHHRTRSHKCMLAFLHEIVQKLLPDLMRTGTSVSTDRRRPSSGEPCSLHNNPTFCQTNHVGGFIHRNKSRAHYSKLHHFQLSLCICSENRGKFMPVVQLLAAQLIAITNTPPPHRRFDEICIWFYVRSYVRN